MGREEGRVRARGEGQGLAAYPQCEARTATRVARRAGRLAMMLQRILFGVAASGTLALKESRKLAACPSITG